MARLGIMKRHLSTAAALAALLGTLPILGAADAQQSLQPTLPTQQGEGDKPAGRAASPAGTSPQAQEAAPAAQPWKPPASFQEWASGITPSFQIEGGITVNPQDPNNGINFGHLFTDKANRPLLNQAVLGIGRALDPKATDYDFGFKLALLYGSDARIIHTLGIFDNLIHDRNQLDVLEADVLAHTPWLFEGGIDFKAGIYPTPLGFEVIDPKPNPFYSHSYIFNYGLPFKHTGALATAHVTDLLDLYLGIDSGTNTSLGSGDNNDRPGGIAGFGLNMLDGNLTFLALTHIGPEDSTLNTPFGNSALRYYNDAVLTWKTTPELTLTAEANYVREDGFRAEAWGIAGYASYKINDSITVNGRGEIFRDNNNFFVSVPQNNLDVVRALRGQAANFFTASGPTTYFEFTIGLTYTPQGLPKQISTLAIRPELRYDRALNGTHPYGDGRDNGQFTLAADIILGF
jgi:Putative beta-barrel porin-2, OmpL-like. bbp2